MAQYRFKAATRRGLWILAASGLAAGLGGCGQADPANDAVERAAAEINTLSLGGTNPMPAIDLRVTAYRRIVADLQPHTTAGTPSTAAAANMLVARAHAGLAAVEADKVAAAEQASADQMQSLRLQLDRYSIQQAQVESVAAYDPAPHLADLDNQIKAKDAEIAKAFSEKSGLDKVVADLEAQAGAALALAAQERQKETALRQQAINASAVEQAELITRANEHKRSADAHDKEASLLRAQAAQRSPEGVTFQAEIDRLTDQRKLLEDAKAEIRAFAKSNDDRAAAGRAEAMAAAELIRQHVAEIAKSRAEIPALADGAAEAYDKAIRAARSAGRPDGPVTEAINKHAKADLLSLRVRGLRNHAALLTALAEATPALPDSAAYRTQAQAATAEAEKLTTEAKELLTEAQSAYDNAGGRGDAAERFKRLASSMEALTGQATAEAPSEMGEEPAPVEEVATELPAADPETEVRAMLEEMIAAATAQDVQQVLSYFEFSPPEARAFIDALVAIDAACREKFQLSFSETLKQAGVGLESAAEKLDFASKLEEDIPSMSDAVIVVEGPTTAQVTSREDPAGEPARLMKINGQWRILQELPADDMAMMTLVGNALTDLAGKIRSGAIATPADLGPAMMQVMMQMQPPGGG